MFTIFVPLNNFIIGFFGMVFFIFGIALDAIGFDPISTGIAILGAIVMLLGYGSWVKEVNAFNEMEKQERERRMRADK